MASNKKTPLGYNEAFEQLRLMINKEYIYRSQRITITEVLEVEDTKFLVMTNALSPIKIILDKVQTFISECFPVEALEKEVVKEILVHEKVVTEVAVPAKSFELRSVNQTVLAEIGEGLMSQFRKVQAKPTKENIEAANSMIGISNTITNIAKLELAAFSLANREKK